MPRSLSIAKVHAYGFKKTSTGYLKDYLNHPKLKIKIYNTFSNLTNILCGVPQGSILGPLIFNVFLYDLFLFRSNIKLLSYGDDSTPFAMGGSSELEVINQIKSVVESLTLWFWNNCMKVNPDKFHLFVSKKFFRIKIDNKLTLREHVEGLCNKASQKVSAQSVSLIYS